MKIIKLGCYFDAFNNEQINKLFSDIERIFNDTIFRLDETVCHYFPRTALLSIVKEKKFYFSDTEFLNDSTEMEHFYSVIEKVVSRTKTESVAIKILKNILRIKPIIDNDISFLERTEERQQEDNFIYNRRNYVFCCSLDDDCLSNWKYYGKGNVYDAYNVVFDAEQYLAYIKSVLELKEYKCLAGIVIYDDRIKMKMLEDLIQKVDKFVKTASFDPEMMQLLETRLFYFIMDMSLFFKDSAYKDEKEYRFVISLDNSKIKNNNLEYDFRYANDVLIPYLKIPFDKDMIKLIGIGPCMDSNLSAKSISALLQYYNYENTFVGKSTIPLRY